MLQKSYKKTINVTSEDIINGTPSDAECCPIALAVKRAFGDKLLDIEIDVNGFRLVTAEGNFVGRPPDNACGFIHSFDDGVSCEPFEFDIEFVEEG